MEFLTNYKCHRDSLSRRYLFYPHKIVIFFFNGDRRHTHTSDQLLLLEPTPADRRALHSAPLKPRHTHEMYTHTHTQRERRKGKKKERGCLGCRCDSLSDIVRFRPWIGRSF